jgi:hypothetical protein
VRGRFLKLLFTNCADILVDNVGGQLQESPQGNAREEKDWALREVWGGSSVGLGFSASLTSVYFQMVTIPHRKLSPRTGSGSLWGVHKSRLHIIVFIYVFYSTSI